MVGCVLALTLHVLIVDRTAVANPREAVEHDHLAGPLDQRRVGDQVLGVFQDRKIDARIGDDTWRRRLPVSWALELMPRNTTPFLRNSRLSSISRGT